MNGAANNGKSTKETTMSKTINAFLSLTAQLKTVTTRKRLAKAVLGSKHPITCELRATQRALRAERAEVGQGMVILGQDGGLADIVAAHGVDEGAYVEELLRAAAEMGEGEGAEA